MMKAFWFALLLLAGALHRIAGVGVNGEAAIVVDDAGTLQINSSNPLADPVLLNGQDVVDMLQTHLSMLEANQQLLANQRSHATSLRQTMCSLHPAHTSAIPGIGEDGGSWAGGAAAPNGLIYGIPYGASAVLIVNPATRTIDTTSITSLGSENRKWFDGVLAPNNNIIYAMPSDNANVLAINPATNTANLIALGGSDQTVNKFRGGVPSRRWRRWPSRPLG